MFGRGRRVPKYGRRVECELVRFNGRLVGKAAYLQMNEDVSVKSEDISVAKSDNQKHMRL